MSRNGAGTYVLPAGQPVVTGTTISSATHNTLATDLANALTTSIATDGQSVVTANIPFAGYKLTGIGAATVAGDALRFENIALMGASNQAQTYTAFTTGGTSTAYTLTTVPAAAALVEDQRYQVEWHTTSGATPTLARDGLTAKNIKVYDSTGAKVAPATGALVAGVKSDVVYDGTDYVVLANVSMAAVMLTGNQTIAGVKTFSSTPIIPFAAGTPLKVLGTAIATLDNATGTYATVTSLAITPASSSNKVLVCMTGQLTSDTLAAANVAAQWQILRGVTQIASGSTFADTSAGGVGVSNSMACTLLDAPATGSSVTYFLQIRTTNSSSFSRARNSSITLIEVQG